MVEPVKIFLRTYVYWVGLIFGFAIAPGSLLFTIGVAPGGTPLLLAPVAGLLLLVLDPPSTWDPPLWRTLLIRVCGAGFATIALIGFYATTSYYGSRHWSETLVSLGLGWIAFTVVAGYALKAHTTRFKPFEGRNRDAIRAFTLWIGIFLGVFYIPTTGLAAAGTIFMVFPLFGTFLTGLVLLIVDPPRRWTQPCAVALWIRVFSSGAAALLLSTEGTVYRDTYTNELFIGDWQENLIFCMGTWGLYVVLAAVVVGGTYFMRDPNHTSI